MAKTMVDGLTTELQQLCDWAKFYLKEQTDGIPEKSGLFAEKDRMVVSMLKARIKEVFKRY